MHWTIYSYVCVFFLTHLLFAIFYRRYSHSIYACTVQHFVSVAQRVHFCHFWLGTKIIWAFTKCSTVYLGVNINRFSAIFPENIYFICICLTINILWVSGRKCSISEILSDIIYSVKNYIFVFLHRKCYNRKKYTYGFFGQLSRTVTHLQWVW